jgi:hypothetical protein
MHGPINVKIFFSTYLYYFSLSSTVFVERVSLLHIFFWGGGGSFRFQILAQKTVDTDSCHLVSVIHLPYKFSSITFSYVKSVSFLMFSTFGFPDDSNLSY